MKLLNSPHFNILITILLLLGIYYGYIWVFNEFDKIKQEQHQAVPSLRHRQVGVSGDSRIDFNYQSTPPAVNRSSSATVPKLTGLPPTSVAFASNSSFRTTPQESAIGTKRQSSIQLPPFQHRSPSFDTRPQLAYATQAGGQTGVYARDFLQSNLHSDVLSGLPNNFAKVNTKRINENPLNDKRSIRPQGLTAIAQDNSYQLAPFSSEEPAGGPLMSPPPGPGEHAPIHDGLKILILMASGYAIWKIKYQKV